MYITPYISKLEINVLGYISVLSFLHSADSNTSTLNDRNYTDSGAGHLYMALSATLKKKRRLAVYTDFLEETGAQDGPDVWQTE